MLRESWSRLVIGAALGIAVGGTACTPTLEFLQCRNDDDCANVAERDLVCAADNTCQQRPNPADVACSETPDCVSAFDELHVCGPEGTCASLMSELCTEVVQPEDVDPEDIVYIGSILAVSPPFEDAVLPIQNAARLAVEEFNSVTTLDGGRSVGWIGCDSAGKPDLAVEAAEHLIEQVGVPAIIGPTFSEEVLEVASEVALDNETFIMSPAATNKTLTDLSDDGLIWRTIGSDIQQANAIADRIGQLDPVPSRVLVLAKNDAYGSGLLEDFLARMESSVPDPAVATLLYPDPTGFDDAGSLKAAYGTVIASGFEHGAEAVVILGTSEARDLMLAYLLALDGTSTPVPKFLVSHGALPALAPTVEVVADEFKPVLMTFLEGVSPVVQSPTNFGEFNARYRIAFSELDPLTASPLGYDAAMTTLLAMAAAGDGNIDGLDIARAMPKLVDPSGAAVPFSGGLQFIATARDALVSGQSIDVDGVSGPLDFDLVTGEVRTDLLGWDVVPRSGTTTEPTLVPRRVYLLDDATPTGAWAEL